MCQRDGDIQLMGGSYQWEARVEIFLSGDWATITDSIWTVSDAEVVCRKLGHFKPGSVLHYYNISLQCTTASAHFYKPIMCINKCVSLLTGVASKHCGKVTCSLITSVFQFRIDTQHIRWKMHFLVRLKLCTLMFLYKSCASQ